MLPEGVPISGIPSLPSVGLGRTVVDDVELFHERSAGIVHGGVVGFSLVTVDDAVVGGTVEDVVTVLVSNLVFNVEIISGEIFSSFFRDFTISLPAGAIGAVVTSS